MKVPSRRIPRAKNPSPKLNSLEVGLTAGLVFIPRQSTLSQKRMPSALILDFDGLILDTETALLDGWDKVHTDHGLKFDREAGSQVIGHHGVHYDPWSEFPAITDRSQLEAEFEVTKREIVRHQPILPGVLALLELAEHKGIPCAVASNSHHPHVDGHLKRLGLFERFQTVVCRDDVPEPKPAPDVYLATCAQLGVSAQDAIAFEDSAPGHLAAHRAGITVIVVPNPSTRGRAFPHAHRILDSLADFNLGDI